MQASENVFIAENGLVPVNVWQTRLAAYETGLVEAVRNRLIKTIPGLAEKFNRNGRYFGFRIGNGSDFAYIYVQKRRLVIDVHIDRAKEKELRAQGFIVKYNHNFQGQAGWLTGWRVPSDFKDEGAIVKWLRLAIKRS